MKDDPAGQLQLLLALIVLTHCNSLCLSVHPLRSTGHLRLNISLSVGPTHFYCHPLSQSTATRTQPPSDWRVSRPGGTCNATAMSSASRWWRCGPPFPAQGFLSENSYRSPALPRAGKMSIFHSDFRSAEPGPRLPSITAASIRDCPTAH